MYILYIYYRYTTPHYKDEKVLIQNLILLVCWWYAAPLSFHLIMIDNCDCIKLSTKMIVINFWYSTFLFWSIQHHTANVWISQGSYSSCERYAYNFTACATASDLPGCLKSQGNVSTMKCDAGYHYEKNIFLETTISEV